MRLLHRVRRWRRSGNSPSTRPGRRDVVGVVAGAMLVSIRKDCCSVASSYAKGLDDAFDAGEVSVEGSLEESVFGVAFDGGAAVDEGRRHGSALA